MTQQQIGRYQIKRKVGQGGMASVYIAYDPMFERDVAVKLMPEQFINDEQFNRRFQREAKTVAALEHSAIVPVYDYGQQDGRPYLVMRLMAGGSLADRLANGSIPFAETIKIFRRVGEALDYAHKRGIVHRDLKPANILFDQAGDAYLADFGIVKVASENESKLTQTGGIIGTPAYMSPEQVVGDEQLDGRSDIYALGVILFQLLTGTPPYMADTPAKAMMKHVLEPIPQVNQYNPNLPQQFNAVVQKAMAKDRDARFSTANDLTDALNTAVHDKPAAADYAALAETKLPQPKSGISVPEQTSGVPTWVFVAVGVIGLAIIGSIVVVAGMAFFGSDEDAPIAEATEQPLIVEVVETPIEAQPPTSTVAPPPTEAPIEAIVNTPIPEPTVPPPTTAPEVKGALSETAVIGGQEGTGPGFFNDTRFVAVDGKGFVYTADFQGGRIQVFDPNGNFVNLWFADGVDIISSMVADRDGRLYILASSDEIYQYDGQSGQLLLPYQDPGFWLDDLVMRVDGQLLAVGSDGAVVYQPDGTIAQRLPDIFEVYDGSISIADVATDGENNFYVLPVFDQTILKFDENGRFLDRIGQEGDEPGDLDSANSIAIDGQGRIFVDNFWGMTLLDGNGRLLEEISVDGVAFAMVFDVQNNLIRMNRNDNRVELYEVR